MPIGGVAAAAPVPALARALDAVETALRALGCGLARPLLTLQTLTFTAIPALRLTTRGLLAVKSRATRARPALSGSSGLPPMPTTSILTPAFLTAAAANFLFFTGLAGFVLLPLHLRHLGATDAQMGLIMGCYSATAIVIQPLVGAWVDRGRPPRLPGDRRRAYRGGGSPVRGAAGFPRAVPAPAGASRRRVLRLLHCQLHPGHRPGAGRAPQPGARHLRDLGPHLRRGGPGPRRAPSAGGGVPGSVPRRGDPAAPRRRSSRRVSSSPRRTRVRRQRRGARGPAARDRWRRRGCR